MYEVFSEIFCLLKVEMFNNLFETRRWLRAVRFIIATARDHQRLLFFLLRDADLEEGNIYFF